MDWNSKWDWENFVESPKKLQLVDWTIADDSKNGGSFNLSHSGVSAKNSLSASTDSSVEEGKQTPNSTLMKIQGFSGNCDKKQTKTTEVSESFPHLKASMGSAEPLIGLKLGKRTYFENNGAEGNVKKTSTTALKKTKQSGQNINMPRCVVEGCKIDLSMAKVYHQKHRVCDLHSKCLKVVVGGLECRFCQQCSRFHNLSEFDEEKRSCRRRLSDHNARRRKPQPERTIQFNSMRHSSPFYGKRQLLSFRLNDSPLILSRNYVDATWDSTRNSKFTLTKGEGDISESINMPGIKLPRVINMHDTSQPLNPVSKGSRLSRALSLLSNNKWGPSMSMSAAHHPLHENGTRVTDQYPKMHTIPEAVVVPGHDDQSNNHNFQESQLLLVNPYEAELFSQILK